MRKKCVAHQFSTIAAKEFIVYVWSHLLNKILIIIITFSTWAEDARALALELSKNDHFKEHVANSFQLFKVFPDKTVVIFDIHQTLGFPGILFQ